MATAHIELVDEGNQLVYIFENEEDYQSATQDADGDAGNIPEWVKTRPMTSSD